MQNDGQIMGEREIKNNTYKPPQSSYNKPKEYPRETSSVSAPKQTKQEIP